MMTKIKKFKNWIIALIFGSVALAAPFVIPDNSFEDLDNVQKISDKYEIDLGEGSKIKLGGSGVDFKPHAKLGKWDDEVEINIWLETDKKIKPKQDKEKLKWRDNKREVHFYTIDDNKFEFEIILNEKPDSNIVELKIESKGLDFYYQPELTQEEKDLGASRPENVIGSYAIYHKSKQGDYSQMGLKNYQTGKAFHIFRPRIVDSAGNEVWGVLNIDIENNLLTVEIPWLFLNNAVYPVRHAAGLTLGYTGIGGTLAAIFAPNNIYASYSFSPSANGTLDDIKLYKAGSSNPGVARAVVYKESDDTLIAVSAEYDHSSTVEWKTFDLGDENVVNGIDYMIGCWLGGAVNWDGAYDAVANFHRAKETEPYHATNNPPSPCGWSEGKPYGADLRFSFYATYTAGAEEERRIIKVE